MLEELGAHIIDADAICRELVKPGHTAWKEIVDSFGKQILSRDQSIDRAALAHIVFSDEARKRALEEILHPKVFVEEDRIYDEIRKKDAGALVVIDAALLIESGNYKRVDKVVVVACDRETQIRRGMKRSTLTREEVEKRIRSQMELQEKIRVADYVLQNDSDVDSLSLQVDNLYSELKTLAAGGGSKN